MADDKHPRGAILQRDKKTYAIVPRTPVGLVTPQQLETIGRVARDFDIPIIKITSGQRFALVGLPPEKVEEVWQALAMDVGPAKELCVHYVQACPGTEVCSLGVQDSLGLGLELEQKLVGYDSPAKLKIGVSGCPMCCGESWVRDVGLIGKKKGWTVVVGGCSAGRPRIADLLAENLERDQAVALVSRFVDYYRDNAGKRLRAARFVEKVGIEEVRKAVL